MILLHKREVFLLAQKLLGFKIQTGQGLSLDRLVGTIRDKLPETDGSHICQPFRFHRARR